MNEVEQWVRDGIKIAEIDNHLQTGNCLHFHDWSVWDYEKGKCTLSYTSIALKAYVMERLTFPFELDVLRDMRTANAGVGR